jgi:YbbR domain-containing protein
MNKFFTKNLPWKITSLVLASILWLFVINTQNPMQPRDIKVNSVTIKGLTQLAEKGFVLKNQDKIKSQKFSIRIKGPRLETDKVVMDNTLINVSLDLAQYMNDLSADSVQNVAKYDTSVPSGITILDIRPEIGNIILEREQTVSQDILYTIVGNTDSEYTALTPIINPSSIEIGGAKSDVERVNKAVVEINIETFSEDELIQTVPVKVYDEDGEEILGLKKMPQFVEVKLPIGKKKTVPIEATFQGALPQGYVQTNVIVTPEQVTIVGKAEVVDQVQKIQLKPIKLNDFIRTNVVTAEMILPKGIQYIDNIDGTVNVTVEIQKENSFSYMIPANELQLQVLGMSEGLGYEILTENIEVKLSATAEELLALKNKDITAAIDFTGLTEGEYTLPLDVKVSDRFTIVNKPININVRLLNITPPEGQEESEEQIQ